MDKNKPINLDSQIYSTENTAKKNTPSYVGASYSKNKVEPRNVMSSLKDMTEMDSSVDY